MTNNITATTTPKGNITAATFDKTRDNAAVSTPNHYYSTFVSELPPTRGIPTGAASACFDLSKTEDYTAYQQVIRGKTVTINTEQVTPVEAPTTLLSRDTLCAPIVGKDTKVSYAEKKEAVHAVMEDYNLGLTPRDRKVIANNLYGNSAALFLDTQAYNYGSQLTDPLDRVIRIIGTLRCALPLYNLSYLNDVIQTYESYYHYHKVGANGFSGGVYNQDVMSSKPIYDLENAHPETRGLYFHPRYICPSHLYLSKHTTETGLINVSEVLGNLVQEVFTDLTGALCGGNTLHTHADFTRSVVCALIANVTWVMRGYSDIMILRTVAPLLSFSKLTTKIDGSMVGSVVARAFRTAARKGGHLEDGNLTITATVITAHSTPNILAGDIENADYVEAYQYPDTRAPLYCTNPLDKYDAPITKHTYQLSTLLGTVYAL